MAKYIDGFLLPIKVENVEGYTEVARVAGEIWKQHGALEYIEAQIDDPGHDEMISFVKAGDAQEGETVIFAFIVLNQRKTATVSINS